MLLERVANKAIALKFIQKKNITGAPIGQFLLEVDRLKTTANLSDGEIINRAFENIIRERVWHPIRKSRYYIFCLF